MSLPFSNVELLVLALMLWPQAPVLRLPPLEILVSSEVLTMTKSSTQRWVIYLAISPSEEPRSPGARRLSASVNSLPCEVCKSVSQLPRDSRYGEIIHHFPVWLVVTCSMCLILVVVGPQIKMGIVQTMHSVKMLSASYGCRLGARRAHRAYVSLNKIKYECYVSLK